jgi:hypothetical protein
VSFMAFSLSGVCAPGESVLPNELIGNGTARGS